MQNAVHHHSAEKQTRRDEIVSALSYYVGDPRRIGTLPDRPALCAHTFLKAFPTCHVIGIESDPAVFEKIERSPRMTLIRSRVEDWIEDEQALTERARDYPRYDDHFDGFFFDFYGWPTRDRMTAICEFLANDRIVHPEKPCVIAYTFQKTIRNRDGEGDRAALDEDLTEHLLMDEPMVNSGSIQGLLHVRIGNRLGERVLIEPVSHCEYRCEDGSAQMLFGISMVRKLIY